MVELKSSKTLEKGNYELRALIDGGGLTYHLACAYENILDNKKIENAVWAYLDYTFSRLECSEYLIALDSKHNWRYNVSPTYKENRKSKILPRLYNYIKDMLIVELGAYDFEGLEADDVISIEHTRNEQRYKDKKQNWRTIVVSSDKDLMQLGGHIYKPKHSLGYNTDCFYYLKNREKIELLAYQILAGDTSDNVKSIEGIGSVGAKRIIDQYDLVKKAQEAEELTDEEKKQYELIKPNREIEGMLDWAYYHYQKQYGVGLSASLYAINSNYNMVNLVKCNPKYTSKYPNTPFQRWTR